MDDAGYREQARQLLRRMTTARAATGAPSMSRRRRVFRALGAAALVALAPLPLRAAVALSRGGGLDGARLDIVPGSLGPQLLAAGAIEPSRFAQACASSGVPLDAERLRVLGTGSDTPIAFDTSSAHFLLNLFWAVGLANANPVLTRGPMVQNGLSRIASYASTGGWTLATRPVLEVYARLPLVPLTKEQQERLEEVAANVYRPCCDNATDFPDCNHGMAMLGLLTRLAAEDRDVDLLFAAAKVANRYWFPQESGQLARYVETSRGVQYAQLDAREAGSRALFSASGLRKVTAWLTEHGLGGSAGGANCAA